MGAKVTPNFSNGMKLADRAAERSNDPNTKCGAVIFDSKGNYVSSGCNRFPKGVAEDERMNDRALKNEIVVHSEPVAIFLAGHRSIGGTMYVSRFPCCRCAGLIIECGITRVVTREPSGEFAERWGESVALAKKMFDEAGVELYTV